MFALQTSQWNRPSKSGDGHALRHPLARAALVAATLMLFMFVIVEKSHACASEDDITASSTPAATQSIAKQQVIENQLAVTSSAIKLATKRISCCGSGPCSGLACAGLCCHACSEGAGVTGWMHFENITLSFDIPPPETNVSSIDLDTQFRPPRTTL